jgi:FAD/FMN-containing dehydrogenase
MNRRRLLQAAMARAAASGVWQRVFAPVRAAAAVSPSRVRPGDPAWPSEANWARLGRDVGGQLVRPHSPLITCQSSQSNQGCASVFKALSNPYYIGDEPALTQSLGLVDGWISQPSAYAVEAETTDDVVAAVNFARERNLRLVVKGGGHSFQGTSNAADSLLIWTRRMTSVTLHDGFVGTGCAGRIAAQPAVTVEAGALWGHVYDAVTAKAGRYVQGGGCLTVGVAGLILSGGFGSFSKNYGMAAASLLEAEIVTADGTVQIANGCTNPDLFWGLKGGGGGSLGVVTKLTLRTHDLPAIFGAVYVTIKAASDEAFRRLIGQIISFYSEALFNRHWGEQIVFRPGNLVAVRMLFQGLDKEQAEAIWRPFFQWVAGSPEAFSIASGPVIVGVPARNFWDPAFLRKAHGVVLGDDRPDAPEGNIFWTGDGGLSGQLLHGFQSTWLPASLLGKDQQDRLGDALFAATRHWDVELHFNKGLAGAPAGVIAAAGETAMNPAVLDAFALAISAGGGPPAYPGVAGYEPDLPTARKHAVAIESAMNEMREVVPEVGSYVSESNFFDPAWRQSFWGRNYVRLLGVKDKYDPDGIFFVHHGVGSERWSDDGFTRLG